MNIIDRELVSASLLSGPLLHEGLARAQQPTRLGEAHHGPWIPETTGARGIALRARRALARML